MQGESGGCLPPVSTRAMGLRSPVQRLNGTDGALGAVASPRTKLGIQAVEEGDTILGNQSSPSLCHHPALKQRENPKAFSLPVCYFCVTSLGLVRSVWGSQRCVVVTVQGVLGAEPLLELPSREVNESHSTQQSYLPIFTSKQ